MRCKGFLFDLDGTLVDSLPAVERAWSNWARRVNSAAISASDLPAIKWRKEVIALLNHLNKAGIPWAIVTSGSMPVARARHKIAGLPAPEVFVTAERVKRGKPEPDAYLLGAQLLGLAPQECVVVEDAPAGVLSGLAAGCHVIAVNAPADTPRLNEVDLVLHSLEQITVTKQPNGDVIIQ